ncbi:hypothetical protein COW98_01280 [Candidatus Roizmanbacteria bacterium CG22_combo_CG10-13_8_21_14_all_35_9]|uniref:UDP-N-acetyl-alpha-D-muramoyl-L-alanyl-L-glutamate epimerase n=2 Tax=Candidatus Roizmaniibacteriota TaxID=1752723 RepID=A0A2M8F414_9BACT|nr:MAG: hypothetical protein COW98_01280 [Candidatus Roizmanbacteria bacterium CG22_combo_CG10-13_8_21_14_all_35_9]PJC34028.1 MAG: hypothetical protein CO048_01550 [Candidatus Roizmanbacteria bacterium CG_4_9_14_0_2_um_filter_35_15]PJC82484.1 MAG: hypothetical protein CO006_03270 [Candidatus Roizmanbacteria bacterium CG_4_8_14_3_um_filter_35_14]
MSNSSIHVFRKIKRTGVEIKIKKKKYLLRYPAYIWNKFPKSLHRTFADSVTYIATWHLPLVESSSIIYHFPHPPIESIFFKMLLYSIPMNIFEEKSLYTSELLKNFYNANFQTQFRGLNFTNSGKKVKKQLKEKAILLFSIGKDSLLTYGLLKELAVTPILVFMREPQSAFENAHKKRLADKFYKKFNEEVDFFPLSIGRLRQAIDLCWGWDIILSQYSFILVPYYFYHQARYLFFGNEQSCNFCLRDKENYLVNPVFEQSVPAMQLLQDIPQLFFIQTHIGSLVEPIHEIFITYILHHRYPEIGRFQMSCFSEEEAAKKKRWCGVCEKCARMYIFFKALGISPERVGFYNNDMLSFKKEKYYVLFNGENNISVYGGSGLGRDEQLLAFYLAYKNGVKGELIYKFKSLFLEEAEKKKEKLIKEYFGIHSSYSLPSSLRKKTLRIFEKEKKCLTFLKKL